ncbi:MAG: (d)CMP kinase [Bacteroidia bacterium]|nr:(d)CMP kinase [Bacteroidia bacterium]
MKKINIALDGYAGCGKSTTARRVARALGYLFLDTGAMYRAFTLNLQRNGVAPSDRLSVEALLLETTLSFRLTPAGERLTLLNGEVVDAELRTTAINSQVSEVAAIKTVRQAMVAQQQRIAEGKGVVMDGRDIGTVVLPSAELKVFMTASLEARVERRSAELRASGQAVVPAEVRRLLLHRDHIDTTREESPLRRAADAHLLDTTTVTIDEQVDQVLAWAHGLLGTPEVESFPEAARYTQST